MGTQANVRLFISTIVLCALITSSQPTLGSPLSDAQIKQASSDEGLHQNIPSVSRNGVTGVGLFIGINRYPNVPDDDLNGCVNDAIGLHTVFSQQYGISHTAILTNAQATAENIVAVLTRIMAIVEAESNRTKKTVPVVITYSGHGIQSETDDASETDGKDEYWFTHTSSTTGIINRNDLMDDNSLKDALKMIADRGGHIILISDSCHSGTIHRTTEKARSVKPKSVTIKSNGTKKNKFKDVPRTRSAAGTNGFVSFTACDDKRKAFETKAPNGSPFGRLSLVMIETLSSMPKGTTYDEVAKLIAIRFVDKGFDRKAPQVPQYYKSSGKDHEIFISGDLASPHANLIKGTPKQGNGVLNMGAYHGVEDGAVFRLYANTVDMDANQNSIGIATATKVDAMMTAVTIEPKSSVNAELVVAKLDVVRFGDFKVYIDKSVPKTLQSLADEMGEHKQIKRVGTEGECDVAVYVTNDAGHIGVFPKIALPDKANDKPGLPLMVLQNSDARELAVSVARALLRQARSDRFFSLSYGHDKLDVSLVPVKVDKDGELELKSRESVNGVQRLIDGDQFVFHVRNRSNRPMYVYVFGTRIDGSMAQLYPDSGDRENEPIPPKQEALIPPEDPFHALRDGNEKLMRGKAKIIITAEPFNFRPLLAEPDIGKTGHRSAGVSHQLGQFVNELLSGDQAIGKSRGSLTDWAATTVVFDIENKPTPKPTSE